MKSKPLFFFILFLIGLFIFFKVDHVLRQGVLFVGDGVKSTVLNIQEWVTETYNSHFNQAQELENLAQKVAELEKIKLQKQELQAKLDELLKFYNLPPSITTNITPIKAISYVEVGNYHRVWLKASSEIREGFHGLIVGDYVVGIAKLNENGRMIGYLNGDPLCSYGVSIGRSKALGIARGEKNRFIIDFIPLESKIAIGDEVVTNGMDEIFSPRIPVGKITQIFKKNGYLNAEFSPFIQNPDLGYMWLLDRRD